MRLAGKVVLITGGGKGLGRVLGPRLAAEGAKVVAADIDEAAALGAEREITAQGGEAIGMLTDVTDESSVTRMMERTIGRFGHVDVLVNGAAYGYARYSGLSSRWDLLSVEEWEGVLNTELRGTFLCSRAVLPHMRAQAGGSIINMSSVTTFTGGPFLHYTAAKGGVEGFTRALARQVGELGVRVNVIILGRLFGSEMGEKMGKEIGKKNAPMGLVDPYADVLEVQSLKRLGRPEDLWGAVLFLASDDSSFTTGNGIIVDGGRIPGYRTH